MAKFGHLRKLHIDDTTRRTYRFANITGQPALECAPATKANKRYWLTVLGESLAADKRSEAPASTAAALEKRSVDNDQRSMGAFATTVVKGWSGVVDDDGAEVPFTEENCAAFLGSLIEFAPDEWDRFEVWARTPSNFRDAPLAVEATAKT